MKLTSSYKCNKNTSTWGTILTEYLLNAGRRPQTSEEPRKSPRKQAGQKKKEENKVRKESGWYLHPWEGGSCERRNVPTPWEVPSPVRRSGGTKGELRNLGGECSNSIATARIERPQMVSATVLHSSA